ncbi:MAG: serine--tRNA ligase, partial [Pseudomonadota bacterium]|nr:serine--tRNA ligase [Pseudomonadota bacterium]
MIDPKKIRNSLDEVINLLSKRGYSFNKKKWLKLESLRSENQKTIEDLQASLNILSKEIGNLK